jgi:hypothetical protein
MGAVIMIKILTRMVFAAALIGFLQCGQGVLSLPSFATNR